MSIYYYKDNCPSVLPFMASPANPPNPKPRTGVSSDVPAIPRTVTAATPAPLYVYFKRGAIKCQLYIINPINQICKPKENRWGIVKKVKTRPT